MAVEVTLGAGMSCISSLSRGEDNGSDNRITLMTDGVAESSSPKYAMREQSYPDGHWYAREKRERSVRLGKYCRSKPSVFSLLPRCQGLRGSQKYGSTLVAMVKLLWCQLLA